MFKQRMFKVITALALLAALAGGSGILADTLGFELTPQAHASDCPGGGGGC